MGKQTKTPATPDYTGAAIAQGLLSRDSALSSTGLNRPNEVTPFGTKTWSRTPGVESSFPSSTPIDVSSFQGQRSGLAGMIDQATGKTPQALGQALQSSAGSGVINPGDWTVTTALSPEQQRLYDLSTDYSTQSGEMAGRALSAYGQAGPLNYSPTTFSADRDNAEQAVYDRATRLYDDQFNRNEESFRTRLVNQGLDENSEAFRRQVRDFESNRSNAYQDAADRAVLLGGQEQSRMLSDLLRARGQGLNEAQALASGGSVQMPQFGGFGAGSAGQPADLMSALQANYGADLNNANAQNAANASNTQGAAAIGSTLLTYF